MGFLCLVEGLLVGRLVSFLVEDLLVVPLVSFLVVGLLVDRLVSCLEVGHLSLVVVLYSFLVVGLLVRLVLLVLVSPLVVVHLVFLLEVLQLCSQFFSIAHQLSKHSQALHHQLY